MVLTELTLGDVMRGEMSTVDGPEPEADRRYVNILVGDHKTAGT